MSLFILSCRIRKSCTSIELLSVATDVFTGNFKENKPYRGTESELFVF